MLQVARHNQIGNARHGRPQPRSGHLAPLEHGRFRELAPTQRRQRLAGTRRGQQLPLVQRDGQALQMRAILDGGADRGGKAAQACRVTGGATDRFDLMFVGQQANLRHIQDLTAFGNAACDRAQIVTTLLAHLGMMTHDLVGLLHHQERLPRVSRLTSRLLAARPPRPAGQTPQSIRRGRLTTGAIVFGQAVFPLLDPRRRLGQLLLQREQLRDQRFEESIFFAQGLQFVFVRHRTPLVDFLSFSKSAADLSSYKELIEAYTPTEEERHFVSTMTRTAQNQFNLMLWIKLFPCLGYFPALSEIPPALVDHGRQALDLPAEVVPGYDHDRTLYRHHQVVREYYQILPYGKEARRVILRTLLRGQI